MDDLKYWVAFSLIPGIGRVRFSALEKHFGSLEYAWRAGAEDFKSAGLDRRTVSSIISRRAEVDPDSEMENLQKHRVWALTWRDPRYPEKLKEIYDLPPVLFVRGSIEKQDDWSIAVVGTRNPTAYGREMADLLSEELARNKITVVSGLARGIDSTAHQAALRAGGRTIAVQACGLDLVYPAEHKKLALEIVEKGSLISDYPLGTQPRSEHFPRRNRIMSGLSLGTLVIEAGESSGALITAYYALEQNREVFAVPGSALSPKSRGANRLIQEGAKLVTRVDDILEELNLTMVPQQLEMRELMEATRDESSLLKYLSFEPTHVDEVTRRSHLPVATVSSTLALMELKGLVKQVGAMNYVKCREAREAYAASR